MSQKLTDRSALAEKPAVGDLFHVVDISDTTDSASGTSKKVTMSNLIGTTITQASTSSATAVDFYEDTDNGTNKVTLIAPSSIASDKTITLPDFTGTMSTVQNPFAPQGFLMNGKISVVDTAGITVAIKTLAGADPSTSDPVYIRIGDTVRSITSALSVAKADGTNWCNAGSTELATKEIDYFVYLGYNATDGVVIGFSRYPGANQYSDFSVTTTNEKYCAISTITTAASTDYYEVIGRYAATLSAGAGYTWTVPTFTAINLIQRPTYETRWLLCGTTLTGSDSMTVTGGTTDFFRYKIHKNILSFGCSFTNWTLGGTTSNVVRCHLPMSPASSLVGSWRLGATYMVLAGTNTIGQFGYGTAEKLEFLKSDGGNYTLGATNYFAVVAFYEI
jgi:hypothetical protein